MDNDELNKQVIALLKKKEVCRNWDDDTLQEFCNVLKVYSEMICTSTENVKLSVATKQEKISYKNTA